jgi:hypothetical protein
VKSSGANADIRKKSTQTISHDRIDTEDFAYFVRVSLPAGNTIVLVKLDIDIRAFC